MPFWYAAQKARAGHFSHSGAPFGRQTVAPRSIIAWFHSPGRSQSMLSVSMARKRLRHPGVHDVLRDAADPGGRRAGDCRPPPAPGSPKAMEAMALAV